MPDDHDDDGTETAARKSGTVVFNVITHDRSINQALQINSSMECESCRRNRNRHACTGTCPFSRARRRGAAAAAATAVGMRYQEQQLRSPYYSYSSTNYIKSRSRIRMKSVGLFSACIGVYLLSATCSIIDVSLDAGHDGNARYLSIVAAATAVSDGEFNTDLSDFIDSPGPVGEPSSPIEAEVEEFDYETYHARHHIPVPALGASLTGLMSVASTSSLENSENNLDGNIGKSSQLQHENYHRLLEVHNNNPGGILAFAGTMQAMERFANDADTNTIEDGSITQEAKAIEDWPSSSSRSSSYENGMASAYEATLAQISKYRSSLLHGSSSNPSSENIDNIVNVGHSQISEGVIKESSHLEEQRPQVLNKQLPSLPRTDSDLDQGRYLVGLEVRNVQSHQRIIIDYQDASSTSGSYGFEDQQIKRPLRIRYLLSELYTVDEAADDASKENVQLLSTLLETSFHRSAIFWSQALSLTPVIGNIIPTVSTCGSATIPASHREVGVENADIVVYITGDNRYCGGAILHSAICDFDQNMRPLVTNINICTKNLPTMTLPDYSKGISTEGLNDFEGYISTETSRILGASTSLLQHYRDADTGISYGTTERHVNCVDGSQEFMSLANIISEDVDTNGQVYYEIRTPNVIEVVRNHFSCMTLTGARLEMKNRVSSCVGSFLDERLFFGEQLSGFQLKNQGTSISPLTLALLEDSSWYIANYSVSSEMSFGRGAGCSFAHGACAVNADRVIQISSQAKGFHCSERGKMGCSAAHSHKAMCDFLRPTSMDSIQDDAWPMFIRGAIDCANASTDSRLTLPGEVYHKSSKCFLTTEGEPMCLRAKCNKDAQGIDIHYENEVFTCVRSDQIFETVSGLRIECPRIAAVCPSLFCPSNCSARGVCDEDRNGKRSCICDDPFELSPGCWG